MSRPPLWQTLLTAGYTALSIAAIVYHRDEPFWAGLHAVTAITSVVCTVWPRTWLLSGVVAILATLWGGWEWARIFAHWLTPESPIAYTAEETDVALDHAWEITLVTLWLNVLLMMVYLRRKPAEVAG